jgi:hypothetical protein
MAKPAGAVKLGSTMYLFKSSTNSKDCMISAHGGYVSENRSFKVPSGTTIHFYGEHGAALLDPGITTFMKDASRAKSKETYTSGQTCRNYLLSKYQGAHAGSDGKSVLESYEMVAQAVSGRDKIRSSRFKSLLASAGDNQTKILQTLAEDWGGSILTIRNRWNVFLGVPLRDAIKAAQKHSPALKTFHCVFCRSYMLGEDSKPAQAVHYDYT